MKSFKIFLQELETNYKLSISSTKGNFILSNSGKREDVKDFSLPVEAVLSALDDIEKNIELFTSEYDEASWRKAGEVFSNNLVKSLIKSQTRPFFETINKLLTWVAERNYQEGSLPLLQETIPVLRKAIKENLIFDTIYKSKKNNNIIIFGAPGTGKSYKLNKDAMELVGVIYRDGKGFPNQSFYERVTFHPNYSYAQFVGTYKPVQDSEDEKQIKYEYVPGAFMRVYVAAKKNPSQNFLLLIEEINRANVAAVFGDVFQLLDRDENGNSEYPVAASEDIKSYLANNGIHEDELSIPSNMYIWATMNSADQGVFPMDTAFKRRWEFEYIGIDDNEEKVADYEIPITETTKVNWNTLRRAINNRLISLGINEDKLLGPFFLNKTVLESAIDSGTDFVKLFESKILMYLFEDAAKMKVRSLFNVDKYIYSEVCKKFEKDGLEVFIFNDEDKVSCEDIKPETSSDGKLF